MNRWKILNPYFLELSQLIIKSQQFLNNGCIVVCNTPVKSPNDFSRSLRKYDALSETISLGPYTIDIHSMHKRLFSREKKLNVVEQALDVTYEENRFKHAPSLGRFTFKDNFHFTLVNVHLRPENTKNHTDFRHEINDLGDCIDQLRRFNPDSTIFLGDFNMSACRWAPDSATPQSKCTEFLPHVDGVWDSFQDKNYTHAVQNRYTNMSDNKQFDNIWLPEKLKRKTPG